VKRATVSGGPYAAIASGIAATSFTDSTATNGTTFYYVVSAVGPGGESADSNEASATPLPPPPAAPTGLTATADDSQVSLTWTASSGAGSYNVKRATVSGGPYAVIASGIATTNFADPTATNGTTYFYVVSAVNLGGESANSNEASATPMPSPPAAPSGLTATAGDSQVSLTWTASSGATSYNVKRATVSGGPYAVITSGIVTTSFIDSTASNGTTFYYVVSAVNPGGESGNSNEASATPSQLPPAAPTGLSATVISRTQINLTWTDNATNEDGFKVERSNNGTGFVQIAVVGSNVTTFANTSLTPNKKYFYRIRAFNNGGDSPYSNTASAKTPK
jgi:cellulose 1,4-beta-cellobiosidase